MKIIRDKKFRLTSWKKIHGREIFKSIETLAEAVGMQSFEGRLNNEVTYPPRAALKTFYISPVESSEGNGWTAHNIYWQDPKSGSYMDWQSGRGHFKNGVLSYVVTEHYGSVYGKEKLIVRKLEALDADYELLEVKITEEN